MVESLLFIGARAGEKIPGAGQKRTGPATLAGNATHKFALRQATLCLGYRDKN